MNFPDLETEKKNIKLFLSSRKRDTLVTQNNSLAEKEKLCYKILSNFLILKNEKYDQLMLCLFQLNLKFLILRICLVELLYSSEDRVLILKNLNEKKNFFEECILFWPQVRITERNHYCFYFGSNFVAEALNEDSRQSWPLTHFSAISYCNEPEVVQNFVGQPNYDLDINQKRIVFRTVNNVFIEFYNLLCNWFLDDFWRNESVDHIFKMISPAKLLILQARKEFVRLYIGGPDAKYLCDFYLDVLIEEVQRNIVGLDELRREQRAALSQIPYFNRR